jgi:hypothetical protein
MRKLEIAAEVKEASPAIDVGETSGGAASGKPVVLEMPVYLEHIRHGFRLGGRLRALLKGTG